MKPPADVVEGGSTLWIGDWELTAPLRRLRRGDVEHRLEPKVLDVLQVLIERAGEPVRREEIERIVWSGAVVGPDLLSRAIWKLRRDFDDDSHRPRYIETIPRVGYRLVAPVHVTGPTVEAAPRRRGLPLVAWGLVAAAVVVTGLWIIRSPSRTSALAPRRIVPLTAMAGYEAAPAMRPDGRFVAYQRYDPEADEPSWDVWIREVATGTATNVAGEGGVHEYGPVWSPRGDSLAYIRQGTSCAIMVRALEGHAEEAATCAADQWHEIAWGYDGRFILASSAAGQTLGLAQIDRATGSAGPLTAPPVGYDGDRRPRPSPTGDRIAFVRQRTAGVSDIYTLDPRHPSDPTRVTFDDRSIGGLAWTPDGASIVFSSSRGGDSRLWQIPANGGAPVGIPMSGRNASRMSFGGDAMVYEEYYGDSDLWSFDPVSGLQERWGGSPRSEWAPAASPSGDAVAFISDRTGSAEIWLSDELGAEPRRLTRLDGAPVDPPRWSPDGRWIVFSAAVEGQFDVYIVGRDGAPPRRITTDPSDERAPAWWRGRIVYGANRTGSAELWSIAPDGTGERRLTVGGGFAARPTPDGLRLLFTRSDEPGLWQLEYSGDVQRPVWPDLDPADWANWLPTDEGVLYLRDVDGDGPTLERLDLARGRTTVIARVGAELPPMSGVSVLGDGRILFGRIIRSESDLWIAR